MNVDMKMVRKMFSDVVDNKITREFADRWAYDVMQKCESGNLELIPSSQREEIWDAVMYLYGIDAMDSPGEYLHSDEEISLEMARRFGR